MLWYLLWQHFLDFTKIQMLIHHATTQTKKKKKFQNPTHSVWLTGLRYLVDCENANVNRIAEVFYFWLSCSVWVSVQSQMDDILVIFQYGRIIPIKTLKLKCQTNFTLVF